MADIANVEAEINAFGEQLDVVNAGLKEDSGNAELLALKAELDEALSLLHDTLAELKPTKAPTPKPKNPSPPPTQEKWSRENHPAFKKAAPPEEKEVETGPVNYKLNDNIMAKWVSGDKSFYPARITSITGSAAAPIYVVKFKSYDTTEQLRAKDIRPMGGQKRKADGTPSNINSPFTAPSQPPPPQTSSNPGVISAAASINPELAQKNREEADANAGEAKPKAKKIKATKELEAGKNKWKEFNSKSKFAKTKTKKDSMFRTPEGVHGRVGFTGSGQAMRKDPTRSRHIYQNNDDVD
ncbi:hypothetical protein F5Y15DRAFT_129284 [Xylariaceae sp. FL0016]|nr:hypothetical protein F5Y15DRAFT_129284 [Xylariaceae sp. FL0016]